MEAERGKLGNLVARLHLEQRYGKEQLATRQSVSDKARRSIHSRVHLGASLARRNSHERVAVANSATNPKHSLLATMFSAGEPVRTRRVAQVPNPSGEAQSHMQCKADRFRKHLAASFARRNSSRTLWVRKLSPYPNPPPPGADPRDVLRRRTRPNAKRSPDTPTRDETDARTPGSVESRVCEG